MTIKSSFTPSEFEVRNFVVILAITTLAFAAYFEESTIRGLATLGFYTGIILCLRELGQRIIAEWMDAYVNLEYSMEGVSITLLAALIAFVSDLRLLLLFPLKTTFSGHRYEHWGKSTDAIWMKREFWLASGGIIALLAAWPLFYILQYEILAEALLIFTFFQLLPLDYPKIPTGKLDGAYILLWSGFVWLIFMGITLAALGITL